MDLQDPKTAGHIVMHDAGGNAGGGTEQYSRFCERVSRQLIRSPDVVIESILG